MSGYVSYSSRPKMSYGVKPGRNLTSLYGSQSMQPMSSARPQFQTLSQPSPLDALGRVMTNSQNVFQTIAPGVSSELPLPGGAGQIPGVFSPTTNSPAPKAPAPPTTSTSTSSSSASAGTTDLSADPILAQIKDIGRRNITDAAATGLAGAKNDLVNFGSVDVPQTLRDLFSTETPSNDPLFGDLPANPVLAALNDAGTQSAAAANPFSTTAQLANAHTSNQHNIDQTSNLANLFYSSTHANQLADENNAYLGSQNSALQALAQALSGDNSGLLSALNAARDQYTGALPDAYARAIAAGGSGATGDTTTTPPTDTTTPPPADTTTTAGFNVDPNSLLGQLLLSGAVRPAVRIGARPMQAF